MFPSAFYYLLCNKDRVLRYLFCFLLDIPSLIFTEISIVSLCLFSLLCIWTYTEVTYSRTICSYLVFVECLCLLVESLEKFSIKLIRAVLLAKTRITCYYSLGNTVITGGPVAAHLRGLPHNHICYQHTNFISFFF